MTWVAPTIAALALVGGLIAWAATLTFQAGRHAERMDVAGREIVELKAKVENHGFAINTWTQAVRLLEEVRLDVKSLMNGSQRRASARRVEEAE